MKKIKMRAYCIQCRQERRFVHKSVLTGYQCKKCGHTYKHAECVPPSYSQVKTTVDERL